MTRKDKVQINAFLEYTPKGDEPESYLYQRDFLHKEINWLAIDYEEERKFKIAMAYRLSHESAEVV